MGGSDLTNVQHNLLRVALGGVLRFLWLFISNPPCCSGAAKAKPISGTAGTPVAAVAASMVALKKIETKKRNWVPEFSSPEISIKNKRSFDDSWWLRICKGKHYKDVFFGFRGLLNWRLMTSYCEIVLNSLMHNLSVESQIQWNTYHSNLI